MTESVLNFGPGAGLVGVLAEPSAPRPGAPTVVLLNAGVIHRIGPNRVHVAVARQLAADGVASLRLDMAGIGDSRGLDSGASQHEECLASIRHALDMLVARGFAPRFALYGACSGAVYAFRYARRDPRVIGVAGVDPEEIDRSRKSHMLRVARAARRPAVWYRLLTGRYGVLRQLLRMVRTAVGGPRAGLGAERLDVSAGLAEMVGRGAQLLLLITGAGSDRYNYQRQLFDIFPGIGLERITKVTMLPYAGHTFAREADRSALYGEIRQWLAHAPFPPPADAVPEDSSARRA